MPDWMGRLLMYQDCILAIWRPRQDSLSAGQEDYVSGWALGWAGLSWAGLARCVCPCVRILKTFKRWTLELERDAHQRMPRPVSSHPRILVSSGICILNEYITFICHIPNTPKLKKLRVPAITCAWVCVCVASVCGVCVLHLHKCIACCVYCTARHEDINTQARIRTSSRTVVRVFACQLASRLFPPRDMRRR